MENLEIKIDPRVKLVFDNYPDHIRKRMINLRRLVLETANEIDELTNLEETLKWGEPSYLTKQGSTLRIDWKKNKPDQYAVYFKCTSKLVPTFKDVFGDTFSFEGTRAITFQLDEPVPEAELKKCISATLMYHRVKQFPLLGM